MLLKGFHTGSKIIEVPYDYPNQNAEWHFLIMNIGNDEKVLSAIKEREKGLIQNGYEKIIGLRDMYCEEYCKKAGNVVDISIIKEFIDGSQNTIKKMGNPDKIKICFAIMEIEAWFLGMYKVFERLNSTLNLKYIENKLGFNLSLIDPQTEFLKPADKVDDILKLIKKRYKKSKDDVERICSKVNFDDIFNAFENGRCISFRQFYDEIVN